MSLSAFVGMEGKLNMGNGKTFVMTMFTLQDYINGRHIYSNYKLNKIIYTPIFSFEDLCNKLPTMKNCTCCIDELASMWDCYSNPSKKNGTSDFKNFSRQVRKRDVKVYITAQTYSDLPKALRKVIQYVYLITKFHEDGSECTLECCFKPHIVQISQLIPFQNGYNIGNKKFYKMNPQIFSYYDTNELIGFCDIPKPKNPFE